MFIVDCHVNAGGKSVYADGKTNLTEYFFSHTSAEEILLQMKAAHIDRSVILPFHPDYTLEINDLVKRHPGKFIGLGRVIPVDGEEIALAQAKLALEKCGLLGVKMHYDSGLPTPALMELFSSFGAVILIHVEPKSRSVDIIARIAGLYPKVNIIVCHLGSLMCWDDGLITLWAFEASRHDNLYLDTSFCFLHWQIEAACRVCGGKKILFGSDGPHIHPAVAMQVIEVADISDDDRKLILGENARRLFKL